MRLSPDAWLRFRFQIPQAFSPAGAARACRGAGGRLMLALAVAAVTGSVTAFFLWALDLVTGWQWAHPALLWGLPLGGLAVGWLYHHFGRGSEKGNNLVIDEIHEPGGGVPVRMAPLVLLGTERW